MDTVRIWSNPNQLKALTGLEKEEAREVIQMFHAGLVECGRGPSEKGGRPPKHTFESIFVMLMMYYRHYLTLEALGAIFNLSDSNVKRWVDDAESVLRGVLEKKSLSHLLQKPSPKKSSKPLTEQRKFISMGLNNLSVARRMK